LLIKLCNTHLEFYGLIDKFKPWGIFLIKYERNNKCHQFVKFQYTKEDNLMIAVIYLVRIQIKT